jgi:hypothetical protein
MGLHLSAVRWVNKETSRTLSMFQYPLALVAIFGAQSKRDQSHRRWPDVGGGAELRMLCNASLSSHPTAGFPFPKAELS